MRNRKTLSLDVVDTDSFMEMSSSAQILYFHLAMRTDKNGYVKKPNGIMRILDSSESDYEILIQKGFVCPISGRITLT